MIKATELWKSGYSIDELESIFPISRGTILIWIRKCNGHANRTPEETIIAHDRKIVKFQNTLLERYGSSSTMGSSEILEKSKATLIKRYGVSNIFKLPQTILNRTQTWNEKYGVTHPMKVASICKQSHSNRTYTKFYKFKDGTELKTQGNGHFALKKLEEQGYISSEIKTEVYSDVKYQNGDKLSGHIFDIFIPKENLVIEVKGDHPTFGYFADKDMTHLKALAAIEKGYRYLIWVFTSDDQFLEINLN
jgi:hypothetical protein